MSEERSPLPSFQHNCEVTTEVSTIQRSKYNVAKDTERRTYDGIIFDSQMEMRYYRDVVLPLAKSGDIQYYELQKEYELQPKFVRDGQSVRAITYVADFYVEYSDGHIEVIDIKGCPDSVARLKRKMFEYHYPNTTYRWITFVKKWGGWMDFDEIQRLRKASKKMKQQEKKEN